MTDDLNLLNTPDLDPPMGDIFSYRKLSGCRSLWTAPLPTESGAPERRIIHARLYKPHGAATVTRIGIRNARGFHKCGSAEDNDWVADLRILSMPEPNGEWEEIYYRQDLPEQEDGTITWLEFDHLVTCGLSLEIRRCGVDGWWTPWNLAMDAFHIEGEPIEPAPRREHTLELESVTLDGLPDGLSAELKDGAVRYRSETLEVGFYLNRPGFSHLALDQDSGGNTGTNILKIPAGSFQQGTILFIVGEAPAADRAVRFHFQGAVTISGNRVTYRIHDEESGQHYDMEWTVHPDGLDWVATRTAEKAVRAWQSCAWAMTLSPGATPSHAIGLLEQTGQTGLMRTPMILHAPNQGSLLLECGESGRFRSEVYRPQDRIDWELKVGETPAPEGDWILPAGVHRSQWSFRITKPAFRLIEDTPDMVRRALEKAGHTSMTFRADTATLTNNGASINCPVSMDTWTAQTRHMGEMLPGIHYHELVRYSLERWLDLGPGYASGHMKSDGAVHDAEDEYLMTPAAALVGLGEYLQSGTAPDGWIEAYNQPIRRKMEQMLARDLDDDGLIESPYRTGVSGTGQWSTCWYDVTSYGWKDAWSNAILYEALQLFTVVFKDTPLEDWIPRLEEWSRKIYKIYEPTFYNPDTDWFVGWVCKENKRHDYAFLPPNGCAVAVGLVDVEKGKAILSRLLDEIEKVGMPDPALGLPANLHPIPDFDLSDIMQGFPFGYYQNGGRTHAQSRHFLRGLYAASHDEAADRLLHDLCRGMVEETVYSGCKSGVDWRFWDGRPCGYEGLLTDQFGFLGEALERYTSH